MEREIDTSQQPPRPLYQTGHAGAVINQAIFLPLQRPRTPSALQTEGAMKKAAPNGAVFEI
ncbi:hypothetical protein [Ruegeria hyattellae]|uniref:hypothetical protein n=1 Tax=Ruegeria hyattellae TaxID=3233337 RepID=UPI00355BA941